MAVEMLPVPSPGRKYPTGRDRERLHISASANPPEAASVDEASQDPSFKKFRDRLLTAAKNHEKNFILKVFDKHILNSLDGNGGIKEFVERWKLDEGSDELWSTLITILSSGGSFSNEHGSTLTGTVGYVESKNIRSPSDYYACFKKMGSSWVMTTLAAGD